MKKFIVSLAAIGAIALLSGCAELLTRDAGKSGSGNSHNGANLEITPRDVDGDGLPNTRDSRPNNPARE